MSGLIDLEDLIREARAVGERAFPNGCGFAVTVWPDGKKWCAALSYNASNDGQPIDETEAREGATLVEAVALLVDWLEQIASERNAEVA